MARCFYCDRTMSTGRHKLTRSMRMKADARTRDHVVPQMALAYPDYYPVDNPRWMALNIVDACFACNNRKAALWPLQWLVVMTAPAVGVQRLHDKLLDLGCPRKDIIEALALRGVTQALLPATA